MIKYSDLTKKFIHNMGSIARLGQESYGHKQRVQVLLDKDALSVIRGIIGPFLRDPTLISKALVKNKYEIKSF